MKVLVVGQGGREHAIVKALKLSPSVSQVFALPGNDGMVEAVCLQGDPAQASTVVAACREHGVDLVVVGPEVYLAQGLADDLRAQDIAVFGPDERAARLEASKIFSKEFMSRYQIPTAAYDVVASVADLEAVCDKYKPPFVLKADGLAAGKGVYICQSLEDLMGAGREIFEEKKLGAAGSHAIIEQFQPGFEISFFVLTNGEQYVALPLAQDHKRLGDNDTGPNTGGMGTVAPYEIDSNLYQQIVTKIVEPTVKGLRSEKFVYRGVVFIGLMICENGPQVLEYNVRFGDPETQVLLPLLAGDWGQAMAAIAHGEIPDLNWHSDRYVACVVLAAENYPDSPVKGAAISGDLMAQDKQYYLHAGTKKQGDQFVTAGGRVLNAIGMGSSKEQALAAAYLQAQKAKWQGQQYRKDIGRRWT